MTTEVSAIRTLSPEDLRVANLGEARYPSPLRLSNAADDNVADFVTDDDAVLLDVERRTNHGLALEKAGPRPRLFFNPTKIRIGIVSCGGLCPGINNVIRAIVLEAWHAYHVPEVLGFRFGYEGLVPDVGLPPARLGPDDVRNIHVHGGSVLGLGRGERDPAVMVDTLVREKVDVLFAIGGDGTLRGAHAIRQEIERRGLTIAVVGVPKTIDNDVAFVDRTFGFETAVEVARRALDAAHTEAISARNGIGLVKLMGRDAGFIAAHAALACSDVNYCLVPEVPLPLEGEGGILDALERRLTKRGHALVVVAEGCAEWLLGHEGDRDASGNPRYGSASLDVAPVLRDAITAYFKKRKKTVTLKTIDPSYMIRGVPANANDALLCEQLGRHAVHAAMAGKTDLVLGRRHGVFVHVPIPLATSQKKRIDPDGSLWLAVTEATGQPLPTGVTPAESLAPPRVTPSVPRVRY